MSKRPSLVAALHEAGAKPAAAAQPPVAAAPRAEPAASTKPQTARPPSREGLRAVTAYVNAEAHAQLAMLAIERGQQERRKVTTQELVTEALNDLFRKYGRSGIA